MSSVRARSPASSRSTPDPPEARSGTSTLIGIPWRVAFALQADGWWLRSEVIWHKPNPQPENVRDRPSRAHEHLFLLSKSRRYYYDADAIRTPLKPKTLTAYGTRRRSKGTDGRSRVRAHVATDNPVRKPRLGEDGEPAGANKRTVWTVAQTPYAGAHFATFPAELVEPCILAGAPPDGVVLDPFAGTGTTLEVALRLGRRAVGIEVQPEVRATDRGAATRRAVPADRAGRRGRGVIDPLDDDERRLVAAGRRRAAVAAAWSTLVGLLVLLWWLASLIWHEAPIIDWWTR